MSKAREFRVGLFVLAGLIIVSMVVFMIGEERLLFSSKQDFKTVFENVEGLKRGSPIRMGGVDVGIVGSVGYSKDAQDPRLWVVLQVQKEHASRIRTDSYVTIEGKGLLGDKMVVIQPGSMSSPPMAPGGVIPSKENQDLTKAVAQLGVITERAGKVMENLERTTNAIADPGFHEDVRSSVHSIAGVLRSLDEGDGYLARLIRDPQEADRLSHAIATFDRTAAEFEKTAQNIDQILARINQGPGFAHDLVYGEQGTQTLAQFGKAADELGATLEGIRNGDGIARGLLYGDSETGKVVEDLQAISADLRRMVADMRAGKGTVGALMVDPSVYEDLKLLLGNVSRNQSLRALVRYSISQDEAHPAVQAKDADPAAPAGPASPKP